MLLCPTCGGHFEALKSPWKDGVYLCATRRRKPGVCTNTLVLPMSDTDDTVLSMVENEVLEASVIEELLALVDRGEADNSERLMADCDRLRTEIDRLVGSIAAGVAADTVAPAIKERQAELARLNVQLRAPRPERPNINRLREALTLRTEQWKVELRAEPEVARLVLRRLVEPLVLHDPTRVSPEWIDWETSLTPGLLDGLVLDMASPMPGSWNHIVAWLKQIDAVRQAA